MTTDIDRFIEAWASAAELPVRVLMSPVGSYDAYSKRAYEWEHYKSIGEVGRRITEQLFNLWLIEAQLSGAISVNFKTVNTKPEYTTLESALTRAYLQSAYGKGAERHNGTGMIPFEDQPMQQIARMQGSVLGMEYQVHKKTREALGLPTHAAQVKELLGAIVYAAGMIVYLEAADKAKHAAVGEEAEEPLGYEAATPMPPPEVTLEDNSLAYDVFSNKMRSFVGRFGRTAVRSLLAVIGVERITDVPAAKQRVVYDAASAILEGAELRRDPGTSEL